ncbi:MAG: DUF4855 domain-containing protein, partial [Clostridia bacterium]|nr:DUF4855 domain-containing protein [Clostridia bacterium]
YENLVLTYTHNPNRDDYGRHYPEDLKPYVAYLDENGKAQDFFFDSYLFLPCMSYGPSSARMHYDASNPTKAIDWTNYVEDTFYKGANVDALETAFGEAKAELNDSSRKAGVVLTILYPGVEAADKFGSLGGKSLDFRKIEDRKYAIKWIIDEQLKLFNERNYEHLELIGFYWLEEYVYTGAKGSVDRELFLYASEYLHSKGLKFVWIPWYRSNGYSFWQSLGIDAVTMQPNMFWQENVDKKRVENCLNDCVNFGMGLELEIDGKALKSGEYYNRYLDYLEGGIKFGADKSIKMYYQDGKQAVFYAACYSKDERARSVYDLTYKYSQGILTQNDIDSRRSDTFSIDSNVDWVSKDKPYVATKAYSDGTVIDYQNNDGKELTDGVIGASELGSEWHAFHKSLLDKDGRMSVTIDLGEVRNDLTHFMMHFSNVNAYGIGSPTDDIQILISEDGESFELLATPELQYVDIVSYVNYVCKPVSARYVKFSLINGTYNFVFCSEALVGVGDVTDITDESQTSITESLDESSEYPDVQSSSVVDDSSDTLIVESDSDSVWMYVIIGAVLIFAVVVFAVIKKKKSSK